jgi:hypothetical protein
MTTGIGVSYTPGGGAYGDYIDAYIMQGTAVFFLRSASSQLARAASRQC